MPSDQTNEWDLKIRVLQEDAIRRRFELEQSYLNSQVKYICFTLAVVGVGFSVMVSKLSC